MQENIYNVSRSAGEKPENKKKNRYKNILPCKRITASLLYQPVASLIAITVLFGVVYMYII